MRLLAIAVLLTVVALMPSIALAAGGNFGIGSGWEYGSPIFLGLNYEFKTAQKQITPTIGLGALSAGVGGNYYFTEKEKRGMPRGWRAQLMVNGIYVGGVAVSLTGGQRTGNWDWGVGLAYVSITPDFVSWSSSAMWPEISWGFRF